MPYGIVYQQTFPLKKLLYKPQAIIEHLGNYGEAIINLFEQAAEENQYIEVHIEKDNGI
jgi:hypothetical protein